MQMPLALLLLLLQAQDYTALGLKAIDARDYPSAIQQFERAVQADSQDYAAHFYLAQALGLAGRDVDAVPEYRKVLAIKKDVPEAVLNLGVSLFKSKQFAEAIPVLQETDAAKPGQLQVAYYLAESFAATGKWDDAEKWYRRSGELDPSLRSRLLRVAEAREAAGSTDAAMAIYREFPDDLGARERLGAILLNGKKFADAAEQLEPVVANSPTPANRIALAQSYAGQGDNAKAEPLAAQALAAEPNDVDLRLYHARLLRDLRRFPEAANEFLAAAQRKPDAPEAWSELAGVFTMTEEYPKALAALDRIHGLEAEKPGHYYLRALVLDKMHQEKLAIENYNKFLASANGQFPDQEFIARQRVRTLDKSKR